MARKAPAQKPATKTPVPPPTELVIITGLSGSGKGTALKAFEDLGYYAVDNLPIELIPKFAELVNSAEGIPRAALVIDIREGTALEKRHMGNRIESSNLSASAHFCEVHNCICAVSSVGRASP